MDRPLLGSLSEKRKLMVVFDAFQEIAGYKQKGFEKRLRAIIQQHENISYFLGARLHFCLRALIKPTSKKLSTGILSQEIYYSTRMAIRFWPILE